MSFLFSVMYKWEVTIVFNILNDFEQDVMLLKNWDENFEIKLVKIIIQSLKF